MSITNEPTVGALGIITIALLLSSCEPAPTAHLSGSMICSPVKVAHPNTLTRSTSIFAIPPLTSEAPDNDTPTGQIAYYCEWWAK